MLRLAIAVTVMALCGCAEDADPERVASATCVAAAETYYEAGCTYWMEAGGGQPVPVPANAAARMCEAASEGPDCADAAEAMLLCARRAGAPSCGCCDKLAALLWCQ